MANPQNLKPFKKGKGVDPRINRLGRKLPKDADQLREYFLAFLAEPTSGKKNQLDKMIVAMSRRAAGQIHILDRTYGVVPARVEANGNITLSVEGLKAVLDKVYGKK